MSSCLRCLARALPSQAPRSSPQTFIPASKRLYHPPRTSTLLRPQVSQRVSHPILSVVRYKSSSAEPPAPSSSKEPLPNRLERDNVPAYELTFTCKKCSTRSSHRVSKQGYHHGTVLITCPGCKNRHLISDHLKIFSDKRVTIEDLMREKGQLIKRGSLSEDGDVEFWDDGTTTSRSSNFIPQPSDPAGKDRLREKPASSEAAGGSADSSEGKP